MDEHTTYDPASALADAAQSRNALADRLITPWWYHPVIGVPLGAMFALMDAPFPARIASVVVACAALGWSSGAHIKSTRQDKGLRKFFKFQVLVLSRG